MDPPTSLTRIFHAKRRRRVVSRSQRTEVLAGIGYIFRLSMSEKQAEWLPPWTRQRHRQVNSRELGPRGSEPVDDAKENSGAGAIEETAAASESRRNSKHNERKSNKYRKNSGRSSDNVWEIHFAMYLSTS